MSKNQFTFNDLPEVLGELCDRIASMESLLTEKLSKQNEVKENTHVPITVQEARKAVSALVQSAGRTAGSALKSAGTKYAAAVVTTFSGNALPSGPRGPLGAVEHPAMKSAAHAAAAKPIRCRRACINLFFQKPFLYVT